MFSCKDVTEKANQYIDQELPLFTRLKVQLHLFVCVNCRVYLKQLRLTISTLGLMSGPEDTNVSEEKVSEIVERLQKTPQPGNAKPGDNH